MFTRSAPPVLPSAALSSVNDAASSPSSSALQTDKIFGPGSAITGRTELRDRPVGQKSPLYENSAAVNAKGEIFVDNAVLRRVI